MVQNTAEGQSLINELGLTRQPISIVWGKILAWFFVNDLYKCQIYSSPCAVWIWPISSAILIIKLLKTHFADLAGYSEVKIPH